MPTPLTRWETEALGGLATTISQLAAAGSSAEVQRLAHSAARRLTGADGASLVLCDDGVCHYVDEDAIAPLFKGRSFPMEDCVSGWAIRTGEIVAIEDIYADERVPHELYRPTFVKSLLIAPIRAHDPIGAICLYWARSHRATDGQVASAQALASSASVALDRVRLSAELERRRMTEALAATGGNQSQAADLIAMPRRTFVTKMGKYRLR
jgi:GAF domain-containing protein